MSEQLPPNWETRFDPASQQTYYVNVVTMASQWDKPEMEPQQQQPQPPMQQMSSPTSPSSDLPPNWEERTDPASGNIYYVNVVTTESTWDKPMKPVSAVTAAVATPQPQPAAVSATTPTSQALPSGWEERYDPSSQRPYYVNLVTKVTQWDRPEGDEPAPAPADAVAPLPANWEERTDPSSGNIYYVNVVTRVSQWDRPEAIAAATPSQPSVGFPTVAPTATTSAPVGLGELERVDSMAVVQTSSANAKPLKFVTVGDGAVGKTCLLICFTKNQFPKEYVPTVFDNHSTVVTYEGKEYNLGLWDTAGQEEYDRLRPLSYPNTDCFLMSFSVISPPSLDNCKSKWRNEISHYCPDAKVLLIGTKKDLRNDPETLQRLDEQHLQPLAPTDGEKACKDLNCNLYIECSARTQENIKTVFNEAIRICTAPVKKKKKGGCVLL